MEGANVEVLLDLVNRRDHKRDVENHEDAEAHRNRHGITHEIKGMANREHAQRVHATEGVAEASAAEMRDVDANGEEGVGQAHQAYE